jgi:hypothetical protein
MMTTIEATPSRDGQVALDSLQNAVTNTLERERLLGQYAVIWQDGKPAFIGGAELQQAGQGSKAKHFSAAGGNRTKTSK